MFSFVFVGGSKSFFMAHARCIGLAFPRNRHVTSTFASRGLGPTRHGSGGMRG